MSKYPEEFEFMKDILDGKIEYYVDGYNIYKFSDFDKTIDFSVKIKNNKIEYSTLTSDTREFFKTYEEAIEYLKKEIVGEFKKMEEEMNKEQGYYNFSCNSNLVKSADNYGIEIDRDLRELYIHNRKKDIKREIEQRNDNKNQLNKRLDKLTKELKELEEI